MSSEAAPRHCEGNDQPTLEERVAGLQKELAKQRDDFQEQLAKQCDDSEKQRDVFQEQLAKQRADFQEQLAAFQERHDASQQQAAKFEKELGESMRRTRLTQERLRATANRRISCELSRVFVALTAATAHAKPSTKNRRKKAGAAESTPSSQGSPPRSARGRSAPNGDSAAAASPAANASDTNSDGRSTASPHRTNGGGGGESQLRVDARAEIIKTGCRPFPDFDEGTFMCAHLVKKEFLKYLTTAEEPLPDVLTFMRDFCLVLRSAADPTSAKDAEVTATIPLTAAAEGLAVRYGPAHFEDKLWARVEADPDANRAALMTLAAASRSRSRLERILDSSLTCADGFRSQNGHIVVLSAAANHLCRPTLLWEKFEQHRGAIDRNWGAGQFRIQKIVETVGNTMAFAGAAERWEQHFAAAPCTNAAMAGQRANEAQRVSWAIGGAIKAWSAEATPKPSSK